MPKKSPRIPKKKKFFDIWLFNSQFKTVYFAASKSFSVNYSFPSLWFMYLQKVIKNLVLHSSFLCVLSEYIYMYMKAVIFLHNFHGF
jgi:hypothetical protein